MVWSERAQRELSIEPIILGIRHPPGRLGFYEIVWRQPVRFILEKQISKNDNFASQKGRFSLVFMYQFS